MSGLWAVSKVQFPEHMIESMMVAIMANGDYLRARVRAHIAFNHMPKHCAGPRIPLMWPDIFVSGSPIFMLFYDRLVYDIDSKS